MAKETKEKQGTIAVQNERTHFLAMLAKNPNYFGNIPGSNLKPNFKLVKETSYEELTCVGYNPYTENMEATFAIKRTNGYGTGLCGAGTFECVRFYLDFHDGKGFIDQGSVKVNVHDIPADKDCSGKSIFPIMYVATLKKRTKKLAFCTHPSLPTLRAILSWNHCPPAKSPDWHPVWGSVMDCDVQIKPFIKLHFPEDLDFSKYLELATASPNLTVKQVSEISGIDIHELNPQPQPPKISEWIKEYRELKIPSSRFAFKMVNDILADPLSEASLEKKSILEGLKVDIGSIIDKLIIPFPWNQTKANVDYEELKCVGLDYNTESLVATICIKKSAGYGSNLCHNGSKEYVAFWIDWNDDCKWEYINTVELKVHDIKKKDDCLCYTVSLPLDATFHRKLCTKPNVLRVRGVLSWNHPSSKTDPDKLEFYGNRVDAHVQIKPGRPLDPHHPSWFNIIGGIDVDHVHNATGLTTPGAEFALNGNPVPDGAPFGGVIVVQGPSFPGYKYRFKITNLSDGSSYYLNNPLETVGWSPVPPTSPHFTFGPDASHYYDFRPWNQNTNNVLARFTPGTEDLLKVEMEISGVGTSSQVIQMDNTPPKVELTVDDGGDCTHYKKGDTITGNYKVYDKYLNYYSFGSTWGGYTGPVYVNTPPGGVDFSIVTPGNAYPCGSVHLGAWDKTIVNSQGVGHYADASYAICLKNS